MHGRPCGATMVSAMINTRDIELAVGRAYAAAYPWFLKVSHPPGAGLHDVCGLWYGYVAANEARFVPAETAPPG